MLKDASKDINKVLFGNTYLESDVKEFMNSTDKVIMKITQEIRKTQSNVGLQKFLDLLISFIYSSYRNKRGTRNSY